VPRAHSTVTEEKNEFGSNNREDKKPNKASFDLKHRKMPKYGAGSGAKTNLG